jgi:hypothetical protein
MDYHGSISLIELCAYIIIKLNALPQFYFIN